MKRIFPIFIMAMPAMVLVSSAQYDPGTRDTKPPDSTRPTNGPSTADLAPGRTLFLKNCAHCHGADARGDEGPDLHGLDWTDEQIETRILNGKKGQMTAFRDKLNETQVNAVVAYLHTLEIKVTVLSAAFSDLHLGRKNPRQS